MSKVIDVVRAVCLSMNSVNISGKIQLLVGQKNYTYRVFMECGQSTLWIAKGMIINGLKVVNVVNDAYFDILSKEIISDSFITLPLPNVSFVHGTVPMADMEIRQDTTNVPICYLFELFATEYQKKDSPISQIGKYVSIFFLNDYSENELVTDDHYAVCIKPMTNLAVYFVEQLKQNGLIDKNYIEENTFEIVNRVKIGNYVNKLNANSESVFSRPLSGVELVISVPILKIETCCIN
jgi:hypothetical protein